MGVEFYEVFEKEIVLKYFKLIVIKIVLGILKIY